MQTAALYAASNTGLFPQAKTSIFRYVGTKGEAPWGLLKEAMLKNVLPLARSLTPNDQFEANPVNVNDTAPADITFVTPTGDAVIAKHLP